MPFDGFPFVLGWELTLVCDLRCEHCGSAAGLPRRRELDTREALGICDQLPDLLVEEVDFTGGEPTLRPDWPQLAARLTGLGIVTKIVTNGMGLTPAMVARMRDAAIAGVGVSIDGLAPTHDRIRGRDGAYQRVLAGIDEVLRAGLSLTVITTANGRNVDELPALFAELRAAGVKRWQLQPIFPFGRSRSADGLLLSGEQYLRLGRFVSEYWPRACEAGMFLGPADSYGYFTDLDPREPPWRGCPAGLLTCGITSDGRVKGCLSLPDELVEGDLRQRDLWDIWFDPASCAYTRAFTTDQLGAACRGCPLADQCRGGCSAMSYGMTGGFHGDPLCFSGQGRDSVPRRAGAHTRDAVLVG